MTGEDLEQQRYWEKQDKRKHIDFEYQAKKMLGRLTVVTLNRDVKILAKELEKFYLRN